MYATLLALLNTAVLQRGDAPTRALVVVNEGETTRSGRVRFQAAFPVRATVGAQPVTVRAASGAVVPARLTESTLTASPDLPNDRRLWTLTLEFAVADVPSHGWRAYAATFAHSPDSYAEDTTFWDALPDASDLQVQETDCHEGELPMVGTFARGGIP